MPGAMLGEGRAVCRWRRGVGPVRGGAILFVARGFHPPGGRWPRLLAADSRGLGPPARPQYLLRKASVCECWYPSTWKASPV
jgi:hypothetical protein